MSEMSDINDGYRDHEVDEDGEEHDGNNGHYEEDAHIAHYHNGELEEQPGAINTENDAFSNVAQGLTGHHREVMLQYWQDIINSIEHDDHKFKIHQLPLARIKKVMKADEDVKMISAEAPILFAKGCDVFITELTMRAWIHAEENKRRTLQRSDIANALQKSDMFDFLIDIVPREEAVSSRRPHGHGQPVSGHHYDMDHNGVGEEVQENVDSVGNAPGVENDVHEVHPGQGEHDYHSYQQQFGDIDYNGYRQY
jgi:histone H3/H4